MAVSTHLQPPPTPLQRLYRLLGTERKDIVYTLLFAIITGLIGLTLPLGIQAVFNLASSGMLFSSIYVLIGLVIVGVLAGGILTIVQLTLVEIIQQRIFVKAAFEVTYRLPRIKPEAMDDYYPPELMNRFFDVVTLQKGMSKVLIDMPAAAVQILFGILLLSFYHPVFIGFGFVTILILYAVIRLFGPEGTRTSIKESSDKYKVVDWLEKYSLHLAEHGEFNNEEKPIDQIDKRLANYIHHRNDHFRVLKRFYYSSVAFRTLVTGGLLILGTSLVVSRQMSLGQFVASELVIVLVTGAVDKLTSSIDTVFDMLAGVEKIGMITDLPLETDATTHA
ncbi:ABC transporter transmembrane domain-containing protein [Spirosoma sp. RP8]|uniref:ABC transporter transmembrane domain-containing protein n=1 Tax=Spirosoma liriopis TaxID=2937440 RepID=A0ABT0HGU4_9BACT|nr:ABC transporter transmembrane domain-containing protein [Spirosoma liriopis]MCK8491374.1 ABC transporter transmembrane domain-containing protein [Spirosoma liriopis]